MKTQEFISKNIGLKPSGYKRRWCSSVYQDYDGNFYSYGSHYPLLFKVDGQWFINNAGYSVSTSKHIGWAHSAIGCNAKTVKLVGSSISKKNIKLSLKLEIKQLKESIARGRDGSRAQDYRYKDLQKAQNTLASI